MLESRISGTSAVEETGRVLSVGDGYGQKRSKVAQLVKTLEENEGMKYTIIVAATASPVQPRSVDVVLAVAGCAFDGAACTFVFRAGANPPMAMELHVPIIYAGVSGLVTPACLTFLSPLFLLASPRFHFHSSCLRTLQSHIVLRPLPPVLLLPLLRSSSPTVRSPPVSAPFLPFPFSFRCLSPLRHSIPSSPLPVARHSHLPVAVAVYSLPSSQLNSVPTALLTDIANGIITGDMEAKIKKVVEESGPRLVVHLVEASSKLRDERMNE
ncbi:hypothetical protein C8R47DRAFT_1322280 [Mycena vitilis]|nr:hypothetical protein C8R47DRAFT_1322280 [Mycena vitilis]